MTFPPTPPSGGFTGPPNDPGLGNGAVLSGLNDGVFPSPVLISADGNDHPVTILPPPPPPIWMDDLGNVILPGLYELVLELNLVNPPTTPGLYCQIANWLFARTVIPIDSLISSISVIDIGALAPTDLPRATTCQITPPLDATAEFLIIPFIQRLASVVG